ncbi:hypothetical protein HY095_04965 [Candidatus Micrarchaeota archaeon]|nr:hypothetical protein [Candidatus Micrarchaeota archaeon]
MARNVSEAIGEEEEWEAEEADAQREQGFEREYADDDGENTAASASGRHAASLEFVCTHCGAKKGARGHITKRPMHCAKPMQLIDHDSKITLMGVGVRRVGAGASGSASGRASPKGKPGVPRRTPAGRAPKGKPANNRSHAGKRGAAGVSLRKSSRKKRAPVSRKSRS